MTPTNTDDETPPTDAIDERSDRRRDERPTDEPPTADASADLASVVVERDGGPDECTIYPAGASDEALVTEWLTAEEGSYVALDAMR